MLVVFWFSYNILIIICIPLCMIFNNMNNISTDKNIYIAFAIIGSSMGDACTSTADCRSTVEFSVCGATNICECPAGETLGEHNGKTYCYVAEMGEECTTDEQCLCE